jgi:O-antigen/teichoic acid export membrane protein
MKGTLSHGSARFVERLLSFLLLPILTKIISPEEYAIWSQTIIIAGILTPIISLKFESSIIKFYPTWNNQKQKKNSIMLFMLTSILVLFSLVSIIALVFDEKISQLIFGDHQMTMYIPLIIGLLFSELLFDYLWAVLRISNRINKLSIYIIIKAIWRLAIITLVLIGVNGNFYYAFWSFVLFQICIVSCLFLWDIEVLSMLKAGFKKGRSSWAKILKFSLPLVPFIILLGINNFADRFFIANFLGLDSLASYNAGFSLSQLITFFYATISFMLFPELSKNFSNKTKIINLIKKVMTVYLALTMPFLVIIGLAGVDILLVLTTSEYLISSQTLFLISLNIAIFGFFQINYFIVLLERGSFNAPTIMFFVTGINILLNLALVPKIGILGAALSGFFSNSVLAIIVYKMSQNILKNNFPFIEFFKILIRSLIMGVVIWLGMNWLGNDIISLVVIIIIAGLIYILLDFLGSKNSSFISITKIDSFLK